jgi:cobalt-zinc-cadmium efflux system protein
MDVRSSPDAVAPAAAKSSGGMQRILKFSLALTLTYIFATAYFGLRAHSLALLSEAGHNISDFLALALSFVAVYFQQRPATDEKTFGYQRAGVLAAFVNALTLVVLSAWIAIAALHRFAAPVAVQPRIMMSVAAAGVLMNGCIAGLLWKFSGDVNIRSVFLHMLGDTLSTAAVILGGLAILFTGYQWIDPVLSLLIAGMILWSSIAIVRETLHILLEGTPRNLSLSAIRAAMEKVEGVVNVHDLHVWSLGSQSHALASHVQVIDMGLTESEALLERVNHQLRDHFGIHHTTIQVEVTDCVTVDGCCSPPAPDVIDGHSHHHHGHDHSHAH